MSTSEKRLIREGRLSVPTETAVLLDTRPEKNRLPGANPFGACRSASLRLQKYVRLGDLGVLRLTTDEKDGGIREDERKEPAKMAEIAAVVKTYGDGAPVYPVTDPLYVPPRTWRLFYAVTEANLAIGLSGGIQENANVTMHRHFNAVRLPGNALKGIALDRALAVWREAADGGLAEEAEALAERIRAVFGFPTGNAAFDAKPATERGGSVAFLDAFPEGRSRLTADIATCHHSDYYKGRERAACDNEEPNPVPFLTLGRGARFCFMVAPLRRAEKEDADAAERWLREALTDSGVGAKTAAGYGWFSCDAENPGAARAEHEAARRKLTDTLEAKRRAAEDEARRQAAAAKAAEEAARKAAMTPEDRIREWAAKWQQGNFIQAPFDRLTEEERLELVRLFVREPEPVWKAIVVGADTGKKKDKERLRKLRDDLNAFRKAHSAEVGGKLKNAF